MRIRPDSAQRPMARNAAPQRRRQVSVRTILTAAALIAALAAPIAAAPIENRIAVFAGLDKITARITTFRVPLNETHRFGNLLVTPRACHTRPVTEKPRTMAFVEVDEIRRSAAPERTNANGKAAARTRRIFTGWMNAESPGLNAVEHPILDVWLTGCEEPVKAPDKSGKKAAASGNSTG